MKIEKMNLNTVYINVDSATDRREKMEEQLSSSVFKNCYSRLAAMPVEGHNYSIKYGEASCFLSHLAAIETSPENSNTLILEDDIILSKKVGRYISEIVDLLEKRDLDIVFLSFSPNFLSPKTVGSLIKTWENLINTTGEISALKILSGKDYYLYGNFAWLISKKGKKKLSNIIRNGIKNGIYIPIDNFLRHHIKNGNINAVVIFPFLCGFQKNMPSTITKRETTHFCYEDTVNLFSYDNLSQFNSGQPTSTGKSKIIKSWLEIIEKHMIGTY